jgi:hypothetical protein
MHYPKCYIFKFGCGTWTSVSVHHTPDCFPGARIGAHSKPSCSSARLPATPPHTQAPALPNSVAIPTTICPATGQAYVSNSALCSPDAHGTEQDGQSTLVSQTVLYEAHQARSRATATHFTAITFGASARNPMACKRQSRGCWLFCARYSIPAPGPSMPHCIPTRPG